LYLVVLSKLQVLGKFEQQKMIVGDIWYHSAHKIDIEQLEPFGLLLITCNRCDSSLQPYQPTQHKFLALEVHLHSFAMVFYLSHSSKPVQHPPSLQDSKQIPHRFCFAEILTVEAAFSILTSLALF
jgi:hypothetical protein